MKAVQIKTTTYNGRIAHTYVFKPTHDTIVIIQRILAKKDDLKHGWFGNSKTIYEYKNLVLREVEIVFWIDTFDSIMEAVRQLNNGNK